MAVFSGTVTDVQRSPRTDGLPGAIYPRRSPSTWSTRARSTPRRSRCRPTATGPRAASARWPSDTEYMFFVTGTGDPWVATGDERHPDQQRRRSSPRSGGSSAPGQPPIQPPPETAVFTPVDTSEPQSLSRAAAPGAALVLVGLLGPRGRARRRAAGRASRQALEVHPAGVARLRAAGCRPAAAAGHAARAHRQPAAHLLELRPRGHLLGVDRGLDAVEEPLEPADQLGLGDPQLALGRRLVLGERQRQPLQLLDQLRARARPRARGSRPGGSP